MMIQGERVEVRDVCGFSLFLGLFIACLGVWVLKIFTVIGLIWSFEWKNWIEMRGKFC